MEEQKRQSGFGIASFILGIIGMCTSCMVIGIIPSIIGAAFSIVALSMKDRKNGFALVGLMCSIAGISVFGLFYYMAEHSGGTNETAEKIVEETDVQETICAVEEETLVEIVPESSDPEYAAKLDIDDLSEDEYKEYCKELWYDDIFFSDESLKDNSVKLHLYIEERKFFKYESIYNGMVGDFVNQYNIQREFLTCGVLRRDTDSYVGGQISMYFSDDGNYKASDFETGKKIIIYGDIVDYSTNTWDGYNTCGIIPRYIEIE